MMKTNRTVQLAVLLLLSTLSVQLSTVFAQGTAFTYQGRLADGANPANGIYDLRFTIYDSAGEGAALWTQTLPSVGVTNGLFTTVLGSTESPLPTDVFDGSERWLEIAVRTNESGAFSTLSPRQLLTPVPYAVYAPNAGAAVTAASANSVAATAITGTISDAQLPANIARVDQDQTFSGRVQFNAATGSFSGDGRGLTNVLADSLVDRSRIISWGAGSSATVPSDLHDVTAIAAGYRHAVALLADGTIRAWGDNSLGQTNVPAGLTNVVKIATTESHTLVLKADGTVAAWGVNYSGQSDVPAGLVNVVDIAASGIHSLALKSDGTVTAWGGGEGANVPLLLDGVQAVAAGGFDVWSFSLALRQEGTVVAWGGLNSATNVPPGVANVVALAAGDAHAVALRSDGTVVAWGDNTVGQTNVPAGLATVVKIASADDHTLALKSDGTVVAWGKNNAGEADVPPDISGATDIAAGGSFSLALVSEQPSLLARLNTANTFARATTFAGTVTATNAENILAGTFSGDGVGLTNLNAWGLSGNAATTPGTHFVGTTDDQPLELKVNSQRALRLEPTIEGAPNLIGGAPNNFVAPGVIGATIVGGGRPSSSGLSGTNRIGSSYGFIGGGFQNAIHSGGAGMAAIVGGANNTVSDSAYAASIGGGAANTIQYTAQWTSIGGGSQNLIATQASHAVISGGGQNTVQSYARYGAIGGGVQNTIQPNGQYGTIPGGRNNSAANDAFAAGRRAKANHTGAFVWADSTDADFASTANNQFLVRATGGIGINTNNPQSALHVAGTVTASSFAGNGAALTQLNGGALANDSITSAKIADGTITEADVIPNTFWSGAGNSGMTGFLGTTDNRPLEVRVNNSRVLLLQPPFWPIPDWNGAPSIVAGSRYNSAAVVSGATISGGGGTNYAAANSVEGDFGVISGGLQNKIENYSVRGVIGGGVANTVGFNSHDGTIGGGATNSVQLGTLACTIAGGENNSIQTNSLWATIGGGRSNLINPDGDNATIGGGEGNRIHDWAVGATISGGTLNTVGRNSFSTVVSGGYGNTVQTNASGSAISGGSWNRIESNAQYASIAGGLGNRASGPGATIAGGGYDGSSTLGNTAGGSGSAIGGGTQNVASGSRATVAGGHNNSATNWYATVPGGAWNIAGGQSSFAAGQSARALHDGSFVWGDASTLNNAASANANSVTMRASGGYRFFSNSGMSLGVQLAPNQTAWTILSDREAKEDIEPVDAREILSRLVSLPVSKWSYKDDPGHRRYIGPTSQDFHAAFGLGDDDKRINTIDTDGVALAAIQGLNQKVDAENAELRTENARLRQALADLQQAVQELARKLNGGTE